MKRGSIRLYFIPGRGTLQTEEHSDHYGSLSTNSSLKASLATHKGRNHISLYPGHTAILFETAGAMAPMLQAVQKSGPIQVSQVQPGVCESDASS